MAFQELGDQKWEVESDFLGHALIYCFRFLILASRSQHDVIPTLRGRVVLAADRVAVDVGGRAHG
jgi:hypothetical protein